VPFPDLRNAAKGAHSITSSASNCIESTGFMIACVLVLMSFSSAKAAEDLSSFGELIAKTAPFRESAPADKPANRLWPADVCAEIQRMEKVVISGARPTDRGMVRIGLLMRSNYRTPSSDPEFTIGKSGEMKSPGGTPRPRPVSI
jgi:hypothetical protein